VNARSAVLLSLFAIVAVACGSAPAASTAPSSSLAAGEFALPTDVPIVLPNDVVQACGGVGIIAVLHGDPHDPHVAWLTSNLGTRIDVTWPSGYRARFLPALAVVDPTGAVVAHEGQAVTGGCVTMDAHVLHLEPPFN
jgi:hypothetical protein